MIIQEDDFRLEYDDGRWNLQLLHSIGGTNPRDELQSVGYGFTMLAALRRIAINRVERMLPLANLKECAKVYVEEVDKLYKSVKDLDGLRSLVL